MKTLSYVVLVLFLIVGGLAVTYFVKSKVQDSKITVLESNLHTAEKSLTEVRQSVAASDRIIKGLTGTLSEIDERGSVITERVSMLERNNEQIRRLLDTRLPESGCLLDNSCGSSGVRPTERSAADPVQPPTNP